MTIGTRTHDVIMVHRGGRHWRPGYRTRLMAGITGIGAFNMVERFPVSDRTIMATDTNTKNLGMIHRRRCYRPPPGGKFCMAGITGVAGINVILALATGRCAVVTGNTIINKTAMINGGNRCPRIDGMTIITG